MNQTDIKKLDYTKEERDGFKTEVMHIIGRDSDGERVHIKNDEVDSYFYVPTEEVDHQLMNDDRVLELEDGYDSIRGRDLTRVYTYLPGQVPKIRGDYEHYEADILFPNRFSLDTGIYGGMALPDNYANNNGESVPLSEIEQTDTTAPTRIMFCDIEVNDDEGFPDEEEGEKEIVCLTFYDTFDGVYHAYLYHPDDPSPDVEAEYVDDVNVEVFTSEVDMLQAFADKVNEFLPDVMAGWNFKKFDAMYLISRFDTLDGLDQDDLSPLGSAYNDGWYGGKIKGISVFDMLKAYKNLQFTELDSFSLEDVAQEELDIGKLNDEDQMIHEMWDNDVSGLLEYNIRDVYLTYALEESQDIIQFYEEVANFVGGRLSEVIDYSKAADIYVLRVVNDMFAVPSMDTIGSQSDGEEFEGAEVFDPASEIKDMVSVLDLKSLYPMSMKTINAGPRTKDPDGSITAPNDVNFTTETESVISGIIDNLLEEREAKKEQRDKHNPSSNEYVKYDMQQTAVKVIMNTLYGILGWERFRLYDEDVAAAVTATGREVIKFTEQKVEEMGYEVIYGDTDSVMVEIEDADHLSEVVHTSYGMEDEINESYDEFASRVLSVDEHFFEIEFEKVYRRFMQAGKKKRYAGHIVWKEGKETDDIDIVGLEFQRSDYSTKAKELQKNVINSILKGADKDDVTEIVQNAVEKFENLEYDLDEIGIPGGIGQSFESYTNKTKHVRGAEFANEHFGENIQPGDKPKGLYVEKIVWDDPDKPQPPQMSDSAFICWLNSNNVPDETVYDWDKYLSIQVEGPLSRIIECTGWMWSDIINAQDQAGLSGFGGDGGADEDDIFGDAIETKSSSDDSGTASLDEFESDGEDDEFDDDGGGLEVMSKDEIVEAAKDNDSSDGGQKGLNEF